MSPALEVRVEERLRLAGTLLAAGEWPAREQQAKAYKAHRVAEHARRHFAHLGSHPAAQAAARLAAEAAGLDRLFAHALSANWPDDLAGPVADFQPAAMRDPFWAETQAEWSQAEEDARAVLARADLLQFLTDLIGPLTRALVFMPNLLYPGRQTVAAASPTELVVCAPPPIAWGTSPPWRYSERPDEVLAAISQAFARALFGASLPPEHAGLAEQAGTFALAAAVLYLREAEGEAAGDQFMVMEKKARGVAHLPALVDALSAALSARRAAQFAALADYLPQLVPSLRGR